MTFKALLAATAFLAVTPALAADLTPEPVEPAPVYMPFNWSGVYVGAQVGYAWGKSRGHVSDTSSELARGSIDPKGVFGGGYLGYNYQFGPDTPVVIGIEGDINYSGVDDSINFLGFDVKGEQKWNAAVRARLGYAFDRFLPYIAGGVAFGKYEVEVSGIASRDDTMTGWTVGGGLEYAFTDNIVGRAEYRYTDYGNMDGSYGIYHGEADLRTHDARLGVAYKF